MALNLKVPEHHPYLKSTLLSPDLLTSFSGYGIGFFTIGFYWISHHYYFRYIKRYDYLLVWLNIGFLMCIVFLPFPTTILDDYGGQRLAVIIYAGTMAIAGLIKALLWWYASNRHRLVARSLPTRIIRYLTCLSLIPPSIFLSSMAIACFNPDLAELTWISIPLLLILSKFIKI